MPNYILTQHKDIDREYYREDFTYKEFFVSLIETTSEIFQIRKPFLLWAQLVDCLSLCNSYAPPQKIHFQCLFLPLQLEQKYRKYWCSFIVIIHNDLQCNIITQCNNNRIIAFNSLTVFQSITTKNQLSLCTLVVMFRFVFNLYMDASTQKGMFSQPAYGRKT